MIRQLGAGFAVIGDVQFLPGYCVLLTDTPGADRLSDLPRDHRMRFLSDLDRLGEAVEIVCARLDDQFRRVNLEIQGNFDHFLHAHVWPRYDWEDPDLVWRPVARYPIERWSRPAAGTELGPQHDELRTAVGEELDRLARA